MKKITLFVIIIWAAIGISVAAISIPTISSDAGKTSALSQDSGKTTNPENQVDVSNETNQNKNNNSDESQLKKQKSKVNPGQNKVKTKDSSKKNNPK